VDALQAVHTQFAAPPELAGKKNRRTERSIGGLVSLNLEAVSTKGPHRQVELLYLYNSDMPVPARARRCHDDLLGFDPCDVSELNGFGKKLWSPRYPDGQTNLGFVATSPSSRKSRS